MIKIDEKESLKQRRWLQTLDFSDKKLGIKLRPFDEYRGLKEGYPIFKFIWHGDGWFLSLGKTSSRLLSYEGWTWSHDEKADASPDWVTDAHEAFWALLKTREEY